MVFPDYEGPYHAFSAGRLSGQATLDAIRAALSFVPLGLEPATPTGLWGYSGGALATAWANTLHPDYAPELNIQGVAMGGTPTDIIEVAQVAEGTSFFNLLFGALLGATRAYPDFLPPRLLNAEGLRISEAIKDGCIGATTDDSPDAANLRLTDLTLIERPYENKGIVSVRERMRLPVPGKSPQANSYVYHEVNDQLIPIQGADRLVAAWCEAGTTVIYSRNTTGEHIAGAASGAPAAMSFLASRLQGQDAVTPAGSVSCN